MFGIFEPELEGGGRALVPAEDRNESAISDEVFGAGRYGNPVVAGTCCGGGWLWGG